MQEKKMYSQFQSNSSGSVMLMLDLFEVFFSVNKWSLGNIFLSKMVRNVVQLLWFAKFNLNFRHVNEI